MSEPKLMMILLSFIALLMNNYLQASEPPPTTTIDTTTTTERSTTSTTDVPTTPTWPTSTTAASTTDTPSTSVLPADSCCDHFEWHTPQYLILPTDVATINATCTCESKNKTYCPIIKISDEAKEHISINETYPEVPQNCCAVEVTIKAVDSKFNRRSFEVPVTCLEPAKTHNVVIRFEKSGDGEKCNRDLDCWYSSDQICGEDGRCSCYKDKPSFVKEEEKCFPASGYGETCRFDEQCISVDNHTVCCNEARRCKCKMGYSPVGDSDPVCIFDAPTTTERPTTSTTEVPTTTTGPTTTTAASTTDTPSSSVLPADSCCDHFEWHTPQNLILPTDVATINATCTCESKNKTYCPIITISDEAKEHISIGDTHTEETRNCCAIEVTIKAVDSKFNRRSFEVPVTCLEPAKTHNAAIRFEKSGNEERCTGDLDCWYSKDQICGENGRCSCYKDIPIFVKEEEKCFSASANGEMCIYDEQCTSKDDHTICDDKAKRCECKSGYHLKSDADPVCVIASSDRSIPSQTIIIGSAIISMLFITLKN